MNFKAVLITAWIWFPALATAYDTDSGTFLVCNSPECIQRAKLINASLNTTIDPCTDFYTYVCGQWESNHESQLLKGSYDVYQEIEKYIPEKLMYVLGNMTLVESNQTIIDKVAVMYNACLAISDTADALIRVLNESGLNAWPILTEENIFNSSNCTDLLRHLDISTILHVDIIHMKLYAKDPAYPYKMTISPMPVQKEIMKASDITVVIHNTIKFLNPGIDSSMLEKLTDQLVQFNNELSTMTKESRFSDPYNILSLEAEFTNIPISYLLKKEFKKVDIKLNDTDMFNVYYTYYKELNEFLATTNPNTLYNYAGLLAIFPYIEYVNMGTEEAITMGRNWSQCVALLDKSMPDVLDYLYLTNEPNHAVIKNEIDVIARRLKQAFNETLPNNSWMDRAMRETLVEKFKEVPLGTGYPDKLLDTSVLETRYQYVPSFARDISFTEALYYIKQSLYKTTLRKFRYPEEGDLGWDRSARDGRRPFHNMYGTKIEIPYELFVPPFFQQGLPRSLNYGGIGGTIARELAYSFSLNAIDNCRPRKCHWPNRETFSELVMDRASCFMKQYKEVNENMLQDLQGDLTYFWRSTLDEDVADNTGLQVALKAYYNVLQEECDGQDTRVAGLGSFSGIQLFFIASAMTMCKIADSATLIGDIWRGYSPVQNRVNGAMRNLEEFAKAFNCSSGSPMHPPKNETCSLW